MSISSRATRAFYGMSFGDANEFGGARPPMIDGMMNGTGDFISKLSTIKANGGRALLKFVGASDTHKDSNSSFRLDLWKAQMDIAFAKTNAQQMGNFVQDGTLLGNYMLDDVSGGPVFAGGLPTYADFEACAQYSKSVWTQVPCMIRVANQFLRDKAVAAGASKYTYVDFGLAQWRKAEGAVQPYYQNHVTSGRSMGLGAMAGFNLLNGGSGLTAPWNQHLSGNAFGMSPQEIDACGAAWSAVTNMVGMNGWAANTQFDQTDYYDDPLINAAIGRVRDKVVGKLMGPTNWRNDGILGSSAQTSANTSLGGVGGSWAIVSDGDYYRSGGGSPIPVPIPSGGTTPGNLIGILCYSRDSNIRSPVCPSGWSEQARVSGDSAQGGVLALFTKIADGSEGLTQSVTFAGTGGTGQQAMGRSFCVSGVTQGVAVIAGVGSDSSWGRGSSNMGPIKGPFQSSASDALVMICAAKTAPFGQHPTPIGTMSNTTSGGETWGRLFILETGSGDGAGFFIDYAFLSGRPSITTKSYSQVTLNSSSASGAGSGFMVAFAPFAVVAGTRPTIDDFGDFADITQSVSSLVSFTMTSQGSTPITWSLNSGPSNVTIGASTGAFQWQPLAAGNYVVVVQATNSFGSDTAQFDATISSSGSAGGGTSSNATPVITHPGNKQVAAHDLVSFVLGASDADSDPITYSMENPPAGSFIDRTTGQFVWIPSGDQGPGVYPIVLTATDGQSTSRSTFTVTVTDTPWTRVGGPATQLGHHAPTNQFRRL